MNERIKQIAEESGLYIAYDNRAVTDKELEFFVELIIEHCLAQCVDRLSRQFIASHFGVEE